MAALLKGHRSGSPEQEIQQIILLAHTEPFVFQGLHHGVERLGDIVGVALAHFAHLTGEILFFQQVHPGTQSRQGHRKHPVNHQFPDKHRQQRSLEGPQNGSFKKNRQKAPHDNQNHGRQGENPVKFHIRRQFSL